MRVSLFLMSVIGVIALTCPSTLAAESGAARVVALDEADWPQFRGPRRDGICDETGLLTSWPEGGPKVDWTVEGLGLGYSAPIIVGDALFITGDVDGECVIFAFDLNGKPLWQTANGDFWENPYPGARASCVYSDGRLYHENAHGRVACVDPKDGAEVWAVDTLKRFDGEAIKWGLSECPIIDGDRIIVMPGGKKAFIAALDKKTGETVWAGAPLSFMRDLAFGNKPVDPPVEDCDKAGYSTPILFEMNGRRLIAGCAARHYFIVDANDGAVVWTRPVPAKFEVIGAMPVLVGDSIYFTAPGDGGNLFRIHASAESVRLEERWEVDVDNCHGGLVFANGRLYGSGYRGKTDWYCLDPETGKTLYTDPEMQKGSTLFADGHVYALAERGTIALLKPTDKGFETKGSFFLLKPKKSDFWAHPVIHEGRLYLRYDDRMWRYDIRAK